MKWIQPLEKSPPDSGHLLGGKGESLRKLSEEGLSIPRTLCLTTRAYNDFVEEAGLREKINLELNRKIFSEMRWEEVWDASQRIRLLFLRSTMSQEMQAELSRIISSTFGDGALVVRSSAPDEDRSGHSFAGLHASFTHLQGTEDTIRHIRMVWASLWSDAALLYRQELGLDIFTSSMAVLVQEMVPGQASGILFTQNPSQAEQGLIEGVHGLNPPLVDGKISPDRWVLEAGTGQVIDHIAPSSRTQWQPPDSTITDDKLLPLPEELKGCTPLDPEKITTLFEAGKKVVHLFGAPQDIEWTFKDDVLVLLQARPITTSMESADGDSRAWYLSLHRSLDNLQSLRQRIEETLIPRMKETAEQLAEISLSDFSDTELAAEIKRRWEINRQWASVYWDDFIPFAHGMRLFGQVYNQVMTPEDPYEFMTLLKNQDLISIRRNRALAELAAGVRSRPRRARALADNNLDALDADFRNALDAFVVRYGDLSCTVTGAVDCAPDAGTLTNMLLEMAKLPEAAQEDNQKDQTDTLESAFMAACTGSMQSDCRQLLSIGRSSYRLRDDDNIILGAIEAQLIAATQEGWRRIEAGNAELSKVMSALGLTKDGGASPSVESAPPPVVNDRQITGQPAGPGLARGPARVIVEHKDIARFKRGEIIVCDGVDPNMTFVMPLAAGIIERRGGMLIHGAIIAREYGLPCVTGVVDATRRIRTGQTITVDGYLGIVTIADKPEKSDF
jgi:phosphohistidine swiveling domain-containing protein